MAAYRVLDIETVPDYGAFVPNPPTWKLAAPLYRPLGKPLDSDLVLTDMGVSSDYGFPPPQAHRVVAVSWVDLSDKDNEWYFATGWKSVCDFLGEPDVAEDKLLRLFAETQESDGAALVTWNGRCFDLPVLNLRSFRRGISWPWYYNDRDMRYRYSEGGHCDLMDVFTDYGAARSLKLGDAARLIGLPGKSGPVSGGNVDSMVKSCEGKSREEYDAAASQIARYCLSDSLQTALLFLRHRLHRGVIDVKHHNLAVATFTEIFSELFTPDDGFYWKNLLIGTGE